MALPLTDLHLSTSFRIMTRENIMRMIYCKLRVSTLSISSSLALNITSITYQSNNSDPPIGVTTKLLIADQCVVLLKNLFVYGY